MGVLSDLGSTSPAANNWGICRQRPVIDYEEGGGGAIKRERGGGQIKSYPYNERGGGKKVLAILKWEAQKTFSFSRAKGGWAQKVPTPFKEREGGMGEGVAGTKQC